MSRRLDFVRQTWQVLEADITAIARNTEPETQPFVINRLSAAIAACIRISDSSLVLDCCERYQVFVCMYMCMWSNISILQLASYAGDILSVDEGADAIVEAIIWIGWNKFRQLVPLLTNKDVSLIMRGRLYSSCVWSSMLHGSETWPVRKENEMALQRAEMRMVRRMCGVNVKDRLASKSRKNRTWWHNLGTTAKHAAMV